MLTKNGKVLVGNEIKNWLDSLLPAKEVTQAGLGGFACGMTSLDGGGGVSDMFSLDDYGRTLQPPMTKELEEKITEKKQARKTRYAEKRSRGKPSKKQSGIFGGIANFFASLFGKKPKQNKGRPRNRRYSKGKNRRPYSKNKNR